MTSVSEFRWKSEIEENKAKEYNHLMATLESLTKDVEQIKERNRKVELDKKWEISLTRRFLLVSFTYLSIGLYMNFINIKNAWLNAIVPSIGFLLSTLTLPFFKKCWIKRLE